MIRQRAAVCAALFLLGMPSAAAAQDVTLTSLDGTVELTGSLLGFDGEFYRVDTRFGELTVDGTGVRCAGPGCPNLTDFVAEIVFSGAANMAGRLMPALVEGFALRNGYNAERHEPDSGHLLYELRDEDRTLARLTFRLTSADEGFADLLANEADAVLALREVRPEERARALEAGMGDLTGPGRGRVLALDAIVPVVAPGNPVREITMPDLAQVFAGEIVNWAVLGGPDAPITLYFPSEDSGLAQAAQDYLLRPVNRTLAETAQRAAPDGTLVRRVAEDPFGIGIAGYSGTGTAQALTLAGDCGFRLAASPWTIKTEDYPLTSPMFMYLPARRLPKIGREFLAYLRSPTAQVVVRRAGFVDQAAERIGLDVQGDRFANAILAAGPEVPLDELHRMTAFLRPMTRLTLSFRFETGASRPDAQSRSNLALLAETIESGGFDGRRLVFVGFSDGEGPAPANQRIALARAEAVRNAVMAAAQAAGAGQVEIGVEAFGEALPMACDNSDWGRKVNRRVEVWVE